MAENLTRNLTTLLESARDMTLEAATLASTNLVQEQSGINLNISQQDLSKLLDSRSDKDKLVGLKTLISFMSLDSQDESYLLEFFPHVIKNITSTNPMIIKLVYIYLLRFNHLSQDTALLSINAIQKATLDKDPIMRSLLIRALSGIQIPAIIPILIISIQKCSTDSSPLVRASAAIAISKCFRLEFLFNGGKSAVLKQLVAIIKELLLDNDSKVLNSAIITFYQILGNKYDLLHKYFHHLISKLPELENWSQLILIEILTNYCKLYCSKPTEDDESDTSKFLNSLNFLAYSQSTHVILAVTRLFINLGTGEMLKESKIHLSLLTLLKSQDPETAFLILQEILIISKIDSSLFANHINHFYLYPLEPTNVSITKLRILSNLITESNYERPLKELKYYVDKSFKSELKLESIKAITKVIAELSNVELNNKLLKWCFIQINQDQPDNKLIDEILVCIRYIMSQSPELHVGTLLQLTSKLLFSSNNFNSSSKSSIIWLLGESLNKGLLTIDEYVPDVLRVLITQNFYYYESGNENVRLEILNLSCKSWCKELYQWKTDNESLLKADVLTNELLHQLLVQLVENSKLLKLYSYTLYLCKFDDSLDIRNEARKFNELLPSVDLADIGNFNHEDFIIKLTTNIDLATLILQSEKPTSLIIKDSNSSLSDVIKYDQSLNPFLKFYNSTEEWSKKPLPNDVRMQDLKIKDFNNMVTSVSSKQINNNNNHNVTQGRFNGFGNQDIANSRISEINRARTPESSLSGKKYQLQSLDEFFGSEESESTEEDDESTEEESTEEEDDDDDNDDRDDEESDSDKKEYEKEDSDSNEHTSMI